MSRVLFPVTIFLSAFLLFQVQPIMGRFILPWFGGTPAVWSVCLLFFQAALLAGYAYAHWLRRSRLHIVLLAVSLAFLPVIPTRPAITENPSVRILLLLAITVGAPYFLLSATAPLLQKWSSSERSPWRLYALSNFGSFLALLSYPFLVEPYVRLRTQAWVWSGFYGVFAILCGVVAWPVGQAILSPASEVDSSRPTLWTILFWLGLSAAGSTVLLATTNILTQDVAVSPFLWIAPLALYLLTFVLAFESDRWYLRRPFAIAMGVLAPTAYATVNAGVGIGLSIQLGVYLAALFVACMIAHGELRLARPDPSHLTTFYLTIAAGGVLGGVFVALIAPRIFTEFSEYPIGLAATCLLGLVGWMRTGAWSMWTKHNIMVRIPLMALLIGGLGGVIAINLGGAQPIVAKWRNFYGILHVTDVPDPHGALLGGMRELTHGRIKHGSQYLDPALRDRPTSYYGPHSGVAMALNALPESPRKIAVIGLGTGTMAAWGRPGDLIRFYEINPIVPTIATTWFTFLPDSKAKIEVVLGDARIQMERERSTFDLIAVDAFSSDAIPMHLLTAEAAEIYRQRLNPGGLLLFHISNRSLNLEPVVRGIAQHLNWNAVQILAEDNPATGEDGSSWVILTENLDLLQKIAQGAPHIGWTDPRRKPILWTDDFASLWHVLKW